MKYQIPKSQSRIYNFNYDWNFKEADAFPLQAALDKQKDRKGNYFFDREYEEDGWKQVGLPHTFNDEDLFVARIRDAGSGQKRTFSLYRKWFEIPEEHTDKKVLIEFEGIRQTCYLYVNGTLAGYCEAGVAPFAFDLTSYIKYGEKNLIAVATDNTSTREIDACAAETPTKPDVKPGSYLSPQTADSSVPENRKGVGFFWNCNDFNPSIGGITRNVRLHVKPKLYLTLPIYSNLQTKGVYIYGNEFDIAGKSAGIHVEAEIRNESGSEQKVVLESVIVDHHGEAVGTVTSPETSISSVVLPEFLPLSITPEDAYVKHGDHYVPVNDEAAVKSTETASLLVSVVKGHNKIESLRFWNVDDPYLYTVYTSLKANGQIMDCVKTVTGFRKVSYDNQKGLLINDKQIWLTGYAQRSSNEWAAIGIATDWLKDMDAKLIRESNANHIRWMHVAASPADIRSCDRYGVVCTQPAGDKERENFGRQWDQRVELMRDIIIYFRNNPSIIFWEAGNNAISKVHMREMRLLKQQLDPYGGRYMGCRTLSTEEVVAEAEYVGTMLNRHAGRFQSLLMPVTETEYLREESPRRVWDDYSPPDFDYDNAWLGKGGKKQDNGDIHDLTAEDFALAAARGYSEFFNDRMGGASQKNLYSAAAALCWTDSAQHGRQAASENARMSGRVDPVRIKKQSFEVFRTMQSIDPMIKIIGHWNYPKDDGINYRYSKKKFNGTHWVKTGEFDYRNPKNKTVYVVGSYAIGEIQLYVNGSLIGSCSEPIHTFIFPFHNVDITHSGYIVAKGYDYEGNLLIEDRIDTASEPSSLRLTPYTGSKGLQADGVDIAYFDVEVLDREGRVCPLSYDKIEFELEGEGIFLGGYNSGKFNGHGREDSVIHKDYVFAECGVNRVFVRSTRRAGEIVLKAKMEGLPETKVALISKETKLAALVEHEPQTLEKLYYEAVPGTLNHIPPNPAADQIKYKSMGIAYCKVLLDGDEIDTKGITVYKDNGVWGPVLLVLEKIKWLRPELFSYTYDEEKHILSLQSGGNTIVAEAGRTHLLVNGDENLLNGEPALERGSLFCMEINAVVSHINGLQAYYDDKVNVYRIDLPKLTAKQTNGSENRKSSLPVGEGKR